MAHDITEEFQLDVTSQATAAAQDPSGSKTAYDVAIGSEQFFDYSTPNTPYRRQTAPYQKDQNDNSGNPGEQTLLGWWLRSQSSFHYGTGIKFYEPAQDKNLQYRFYDSEGVDVWTQGETSLLKDVVAGHKTTGSAPTVLRSIRWSGIDGVLMVDGGDVDKLLPDYSSFSATAKKIVSNVATITTPTSHGFAVSDLVAVDDIDTTFNGMQTVTAVSTLTSATPTATGSSGASTITVSSSTNIVLGMGVSGTGIASGAYVTGTSGTTITLSAANTDAVSGTVTFVGYTFSYAKTAGNVSNVAIYPAGSVSKNVNHFIDHNSGTDTNVYAICDDGINAYWVTNQYGTEKCEIYRKALTGYTGDGVGNTSMYYDNTVHVSNAVIEYVKGRLIAGINNVIYELDPTNTGGTNLPSSTTADYGKVLFTHKSETYKFTSITESASNIYVAGYDGIVSHIFVLTVSDSGSITRLTGAQVAAEMPRGEIIYTIKQYLNYLLIGTSRGVRIGQLSSSGELYYGPLLFQTSDPVYQFATSDRYAWCTAKINGDAGLVRIDLGTQIDTLVFPYANDLQAVDVNKVSTGVAFVGQTSRLCFSAAANYTYFESATVLRSSGYLTTGKIRFNTIENKYFRYINVRAEFNGGSVGVSTGTANIITVDDSNGNTDIGITETDGVEFRQFKFTLNRNVSDSTQGPTVYSYQVKALPAYKRQRLVQYNLLCYDKEQDRHNNTTGYVGRAYERILSLEDLEAQSNIVTIRDYRTGETFSGIIEEVSFVGKTAPVKNVNGYGGILTVTVRKIS